MHQVSIHGKATNSVVLPDALPEHPTLGVERVYFADHAGEIVHQYLHDSRLFSKKEINCPTTCNPPWNRQCGKKLSNFIRLPRLPCSKWIRMVYHCAPFGHRISLSTRKCEDASIVLRFTAFCKFLLTWTAQIRKASCSSLAAADAEQKEKKRFFGGLCTQSPRQRSPNPGKGRLHFAIPQK